jgi:FtsH-binding integral membrane protein
MSAENYKHLRNVYILLTLQIIVTMLIVYIIRNNPKYYYLVQTYSALPIILSFILLLMIELMNLSETMKIFLFTIFSVCLGTLCIATSRFISNSTILASLKTTFALFLALTILGWICYKYNINLGRLQLILFISLIGLIFGMIFSARTPQNARIIFMFGIIIFSLYIGYDTFRILQSKQKDIVSDALGLYLSIINLFSSLLGYKSSN